jgi:hypothetical protein
MIRKNGRPITEPDDMNDRQHSLQLEHPVRVLRPQ